MFEYILFFGQILLLTYFIVILFKKKESFFKSLIVFNSSIVLWVVSILIITRVQDVDISIWFARLTFFTTAIAVTSYIAFFCSYTEYANKALQRILNIFGIIMALLSLTPFLVTKMVVVENSNYPAVVFGNLAIIYVLFVIVGVSFLIWQVIKLRKTSSGLEFLQVSYITVGMTLAGIIAILTNIIFPVITGSSTSAFWGPIAISVFSAITTYSVTRHRLFGIKFLIGKIVYYFGLILLPFSFFVSLVNLLPKLNLTYANPITYVVGVFISILFIIAYFFLSGILDKKLNPTIGFKNKNTERIREDFLKNISTELDIEKLGITTLNAIDTIFDLKKSGIVIFNADNGSIIYKKLYEFGEQPLDDQNLLQVIQYWDKINHSTIITKDELNNTDLTDVHLTKILTFMENDDVEIIIPLNRKVHLNGVIVLGGKNSRNPFTVEDINYLESLIVNSSVAFSRSILYGQVQVLNVSLQQQVNEQTQELQIRVKQLQEARRKEADMIDIMGHELRTPATIVKLNAELLEGFTEEVVHDKEKFKTYVTRIRTAVENEIKLINTLLSSAKLEGDKIELNFEEVNILNEIEMALYGHEMEAKEKGLIIINKSGPDTPLVYADHSRVIEVLNNLIDNAIKYTNSGSVTVETFFNEDSVGVSIIDSGSGIKEEDLKNLGQKFYRVANYVEGGGTKHEVVRPGGTGLGLYVTFGLVEKMGGKIEVESEVGKGSRFTFTIPRFDSQKDIPEKVESNDMFERLGLRR
ncbi:MAG: ATP-binding protein [Candidatus Dojkabacteria bacterium]